MVKDEFINPIAFVYIGMYSSEKAMINALKYGESIEWLTVDIKKVNSANVRNIVKFLPIFMYLKYFFVYSSHLSKTIIFLGIF